MLLVHLFGLPAPLGTILAIALVAIVIGAVAAGVILLNSGTHISPGPAKSPDPDPPAVDEAAGTHLLDALLDCNRA